MKKREVFLLVIIVSIALFLRTYHLASLPPGLYPDEAMDGNNALHALRTEGWSVFYPENNGREGLFMDVQIPFVKFLGNKPWALRLPSALFGTLTVLGLYFLAKELFKTSKRSSDEASAIALLSSFFLAVNFWHINFSRISFRAIAAPFFTVWALYFLFLGYRKFRERAASPARASSVAPFFLIHVLGGAVFGLGFYTYIAYRTMPAVAAAVFAYFFFIARKEGWLKNFFATSLGYVSAAGLAAVPIAYYFAVHPGTFFGRTSEVSILAGGHAARDFLLNAVKTAAMFNVVGDFNWRHNVAGRPELFWPVGICFLVGVCVVLRKLFAKEPAVSRLKGLFLESKLPSGTIATFGFFAALPVVVSNEGLPHALRSILLIPPVFLYSGLGAWKLYRWLTSLSRNPWVVRFLWTILAILFVEAHTTYFVLWGQNPNVPGAFAADYVTLGQELNALPTSTVKYVVVEAGGVAVRGIPMPAQTVMFITDTWDAAQQNEKNIHYVLLDQENIIPSSSLKFYIR